MSRHHRGRQEFKGTINLGADELGRHDNAANDMYECKEVGFVFLSDWIRDVITCMLTT